MAEDLDRRLTPARDDLAASFLRGKIKATQFVDGQAMECAASVAPVLKSPDARAMRETELLFGEPFTVYEIKNGWAWGQSGLDDYVGYVAAGYLCPPMGEKTWRVTALRTLIFSRPDIKSTPYTMISMNALCAPSNATIDNNAFIAVTIPGGDIGYLIKDHCQSITQTGTDYVSEAEKFLNTPYLWGGRSSLGLDCSALVQNSLMRIWGKKPGDEPVLRDTDMQEKTLGAPIANALSAELQRGDLVFWKGHVGIMMDANAMIHANGTYMMVSVNDVRAFAQHVAPASGPVTSVRRLPQ